MSTSKKEDQIVSLECNGVPLVSYEKIRKVKPRTPKKKVIKNVASEASEIKAETEEVKDHYLGIKEVKIPEPDSEAKTEVPVKRSRGFYAKTILPPLFRKAMKEAVKEGDVEAILLYNEIKTNKKLDLLNSDQAKKYVDAYVTKHGLVTPNKQTVRKFGNEDEQKNHDLAGIVNRKIALGATRFTRPERMLIIQEKMKNQTGEELENTKKELESIKAEYDEGRRKMATRKTVIRQLKRVAEAVISGNLVLTEAK